MNTVDLSGLAVDRQATSAVGLKRDRRQLWSRYVLPLGILLGFAAIFVRASWDRIFPPRSVVVIPVVAIQSKMREGGMPSFKAAGWIEPRPALIKAPSLIAGVVREVMVVEGDLVTSGQPIARLVSENAELSYRRAQAETKNRKAELERSKAQFRAATIRRQEPLHLRSPLADAEAGLAKVATQIESLPFELRRAESRQRFAKLDLEGKQTAAGAITGRAVQAAEAEFNSSNALVEELMGRKSSLENESQALRQRRDTLQRQLELLVDETQAVECAESAVRMAEAVLEQANVDEAISKLRLDRTTVRAPADGRIHKILLAAGATLTGREQSGEPTGDAIATIYQPSMLQVRVDVRFENIRQVSLGQSVEIRSPAADGVISGSVSSFGSEADIQKNTLQVRVAIHDPPEAYRPEMLVDVTFQEPARQESGDTRSSQLRLFVPSDLIHPGDTGHVVWIADQSRRVAVMRSVECGEQTKSGLTEVLSGLNLSDRLISGDIAELRSGMRIQVTSEAETSKSPVTNPQTGTETQPTVTAREK